MEASSATARLHRLLVGSLGNRDPHVTIKAAWAPMLDVDPDNTPQLVDRIGRVLALPAAMRAELENLPMPADPWLEYLPTLEQRLPQLLNLGASLQSFNQQFGPEVIDNLKTAAAVLAHASPELVPTPDVLLEWLDELTLLADEVRHAEDISNGLRNFLLEHMAEMASAISRVRIEGSRPLRDVIYRTSGHLGADPEINEEVTHSGVAAKVQALWGSIADTLQIVSFSFGLALGPGPAPPAVLPPPPAIEAPVPQSAEPTELQAPAPENASPPELPDTN